MYTNIRPTLLVEWAFWHTHTCVHTRTHAYRWTHKRQIKSWLAVFKMDLMSWKEMLVEMQAGKHSCICTLLSCSLSKVGARWWKRCALAPFAQEEGSDESHSLICGSCVFQCRYSLTFSPPLQKSQRKTWNLSTFVLFYLLCVSVTPEIPQKECDISFTMVHKPCQNYNTPFL